MRKQITLFNFTMVLMLLLQTHNGICQSYTFDKSGWITNGSVYSNAYDTAHNTLYLGGEFRVIGPYEPYGAYLDTLAGQPMPGDHPNGWVKACISDEAGGWFIGGQFTKVGDSIRNNVAHLDANGKVTGDLSGLGGISAIFALEKKDDTLIIGAAFSWLGIHKKYGAVLNTNDWQCLPNFPEPDSNVLASISDGAGGLYIGGLFKKVGDSVRHNIAHINSAGQVTSWNPVSAFALKDTILYVGGEFDTIAGMTRNHLAAVKVNNGAVLPWDPNMNNRVNSLQVKGNIIYASGEFTTVGDSARHSLAAIDANSSLATNWNPNSTSYEPEVAV
jgi:hypothetical protein